MQLEELWRERLENAWKNYQAATVDHQSRGQRAAALQEYGRILKIFTDLVVDRKLPPTDEI